MTLEQQLSTRSQGHCELCQAEADLSVYAVEPKPYDNAEAHAHICQNCLTQVTGDQAMDANHWRCLNDSMWSAVPAVQVLAWRMLDRLRGEGWPIELLDMLYLDDELRSWAEAEKQAAASQVIHKDSNGVVLEAGDTVVLVKDLKVKGANFIAKRGTAVRRIGLVADNPEHIEGRVNDQRIVILTQYVKKMK